MLLRIEHLAAMTVWHMPAEDDNAPSLAQGQSRASSSRRADFATLNTPTQLVTLPESQAQLAGSPLVAQRLVTTMLRSQWLRSSGQMARETSSSDAQVRNERLRRVVEHRWPRAEGVPSILRLGGRTSCEQIGHACIRISFQLPCCQGQMWGSRID